MSAACPSPSPGHFDLERLPDLAPFREALQRAQFTAPRVAETLAPQPPLDVVDLPVLLLLTAEPTPYHTLIRLFFLEQPVLETDLREALSPMALEPLFDCRLLRRTREGVRAMVKLLPHDQFYFVSDFPRRQSHESMPFDHVLGVGGTSSTLAGLTPRHPVKSCLDLCAGGGVQSILASPFASRVVGTDMNERALNFARFNAHLNGIHNIEWRQGSFFEPVAAEQFDLLVANPPFVISPESSLLYRDGGGKGDRVSEQVVRGIPQHLAEGGFGVMLLNWHHADDSDWHVRPLQWVENNGCDCWLICICRSKPLIYAAHWLRQTDHEDKERYQRLLQQWTRYYKEANIGCISFGAVVMRKRSGGPNWTRHDSVQNTQYTGACGEHIARLFAAEDFVRSLPAEAALLDHVFSVHPDLVIDHRFSFRDSQCVLQGLTMELSRGLAFAGRIDGFVLDFLSYCDGHSTLRQAIERLAKKSGTDDAPSLFSHYMEMTRNLVCLGILVHQA